MIKRDDYLNKLIKSMHNSDVKVITGIRRCGKSTLLNEIFKNYLIDNNVNENNIISISLDKISDLKYRNPFNLSEYIHKIVKKTNEQYYLFIDEIQLADSFIDKESNIKVTIFEMLNDLKSIKNLDIYVTGSNSKMLSKDIITEFRGRSTQIHLYPLSFKEYYDYIGGDVNVALNNYFIYGGMPKLIEYSDIKDKKIYLKNLYDEIYIKDIVERKHIKKTDILNNILDYLSSSISSLTNPNTIANVLTAATKEKIDNELVGSYIDASIDSFIISLAKRYNIKGKNYFRYPNKYYYTDIGLRNARLNFREFDPGHIMENVIYNELIRRGYSVDVGAIEDRRKGLYSTKEIDFIVNDIDKKIYIQSALRLDNIEKSNSEIDSFKLVTDSFKKIIIRNDIINNFYDNNGFYHLSLINFLLGEEL